MNKQFFSHTTSDISTNICNKIGFRGNNCSNVVYAVLIIILIIIVVNIINFLPDRFFIFASRPIPIILILLAIALISRYDTTLAIVLGLAFLIALFNYNRRKVNEVEIMSNKSNYSNYSMPSVDLPDSISYSGFKQNQNMLDDFTKVDGLDFQTNDLLTDVYDKKNNTSQLKGYEKNDRYAVYVN